MNISKKAIEIDNNRFQELSKDFNKKAEDSRNIYLNGDDTYAINKRFYVDMIKKNETYKISHFRNQLKAYTIFHGTNKSILFNGILLSNDSSGSALEFVEILEYIGIKDIKQFIIQEYEELTFPIEYCILVN